MKNFFYKLLKILATRILAKNPNIIIIGVTGSVGKSTTKEAIYTVLSNSNNFKNHVVKSEGNLNTEVGLPLTILRQNKSPKKFLWPFYLIWLFLIVFFSNPLRNIKILVLEYATNQPGDIKYLCSIAKPNIAVITKIAPAHIGYFGTLKNIAKEKGSLAYAVSKDGLVILNKNDVFSKNIALTTNANIKYFDGKDFNNHILIATIIAKYLNIDDQEIKSSLGSITKLPGRLNVIKGKKSTTIIDDTYNANPESIKFALDFLEKYKSKGRKIAVLGDMLELGKMEIKYHREIGKLAKKKSDILILTGPKFNEVLSDAWFINSEKTAEYLLKNMKKNDIILVKGSNAMKMNMVVQKIRSYSS